MRKVILHEKIENMKKISEFQHKLIGSISNIIFLKRKAQVEYNTQLLALNQQLDKYIIADYGFLTNIVKAYQSYIIVLYQNQLNLIEGYDKQILVYLKQAQSTQFQDKIQNKVNNVDNKISQCQQNIKKIKKNIKQNEQQLQIISSEVKFGQKVGDLKESQKNVYAERYDSISKLKQINQQKLQQYIDGIMDLSMLHNQTLEEVEQYQTVYIEQKANDVFNNFMRAFVLEVSYIRNLQFDVGTILSKVKDKQEQHRKVSMEALRGKMKKQYLGIKSYLWDKYKEWKSTANFDINQTYISPKIRDKWQRVCEYYNKAM